MGAGLLILLAAMEPLGKIDLMTAASSIGRYSYGDVLTTTPVDKAANTLMEQLITDTARTYILDKAQAVGASVEAEVTTDNRSGYPVPWGVRLSGSRTPEQQELLSRWLWEVLGIPEERQEWSCM